VRGPPRPAALLPAARGRRLHLRHLAVPVALAQAQELLVLFHLLVDVPDVQEGVPGQPDVHEGGLHPRQDLQDPTLVDVAGQALGVGVVDEELDQGAVLDDRHPGLHQGGVDDDLAFHR